MPAQRNAYRKATTEVVCDVSRCGEMWLRSAGDTSNTCPVCRRKARRAAEYEREKLARVAKNGTDDLQKRKRLA